MKSVVIAAAAAAAVLLAAPVGADEIPRRAPQPVAVLDALYPEGPIALDDALYYAEMTADRVSRLKRTGERSFRRETFFDAAAVLGAPACGPTAIAPYGADQVVVLCHLRGALAVLDRDGALIDVIERDAEGGRLDSPNDAHTDRAGGVVFSNAGRFSPRAEPTGVLQQLSPDGAARPLAGPFRYLNGVAVSPDGALALGSEHLGGRLLAFDMRLGGAADALLDHEGLGLPARAGERLTGPDGIEFDGSDAFFVAFYGDARVSRFSLSPDGSARRVLDIETPQRYVTNIAIWDDLTAIVGAYDIRRRPFPGAVALYRTDDLR